MRRMYSENQLNKIVTDVATPIAEAKAQEAFASLPKLYRHVITLRTEYEIEGVSQYAYLCFTIIDYKSTAYTKAQLSQAYFGKCFMSVGNVMGENTVSPSDHRSGIMKFYIGYATTYKWTGYNSSMVEWSFWVEAVNYDEVTEVPQPPVE